MKTRNIMLIGGIYHPFDEYADEISALCASLGMDTLVTEDVDEALANLGSADLFTLYALRWRMLNHEKYVPHRPRWAFAMSDEQAAALEQYIAHGGPMLALHTASICFDDWPGFARVLGGQWVWEDSYHPPAGPVQVRPTGTHPVIADAADFELHDEVYHNLEVLPQSTPLLQARTPAGEWQTVAWAYEGGGGRVVYDALGHDGASLRNSAHRSFIDSSLRWLLRR